MKKRLVFYTLLGLTIVFVDQLTKWFAIKYLKGGFLISPWLKIEIYKNKGIAFGLSLPYFILYLLVILILIFCFLELRKGIVKKNFLLVLALTLVIAGAIANLINRLYLGYIVDIFHFLPTGSMFNLADIAIVWGVGMMIWREIKSKVYPEQS